MDGQRQRQALTAAERSLTHLAADRFGEARRAAGRAVDLEQIEVFAGLGEAVAAVAEDLERGGAVDHRHFEMLEASVGSGPLAALLDPLRLRISESRAE